MTLKEQGLRTISHNDVVAQFCDAMRAAGLIVNASDIVPNSSNFQRCKTDKSKGSRKNGWYKLHLDDHPKGVFGIWNTGESHKWEPDTGAAPMSAEQKKFWRAEMKRKQAERAAEMKEAQNQAAERAKKAWNKAVQATDDHPYLRRKGVKAHGLRIGQWWKRDRETGKAYLACENALLVPKYGLKGDIRSMQAVFPEKIEINGEWRDKDYLSGGEKIGMFHVIGRPLEIDGKKVVIVVEGYATAASVHECTGHCVLVAFDTSNLLSAAQVFRNKHPHATIIFACDNDWGTVTPIQNPGVYYATKAARAVNGAVAIPRFEEIVGRGGDFNDLHEREGAGAVQACINAALYPAEEPEQQDNPQYAPTGEQGGAGEGAPSPFAVMSSAYLSPINDPVAPIAMGRSGDLFGFWVAEKKVALLRAGDLFRDSGVHQLQNHDWWTTFCMDSGLTTGGGKSGGAPKGKFDHTLIGNFLMETSKRAGDLHGRNVPPKIARADIVQRELNLALLHAKPSAHVLSSVLLANPDWHGVVWWNEFAIRVEARVVPPCGGSVGPWTDRHDKLISAWLTAQYGVTVSRAMVADAVELIAQADSRHPVRDYLQSLKWDGVPRLDAWLTTFAGCADNTFTRHVAAKTLIGAVARIMQPGAKFDTMTVLEGDQGSRKSSLTAALSPHREWFSSSIKGDLEAKDTAIGLSGKWIIEMAEMAVVGRNRTEVTKAFLTEQVDNYRAPYGTRSEDHPRQCAFLATINPEADGRYLHDTTGGRRFWPVKVVRADVDALIACRDQLWAEAFARHQSGEQWWLSAELEKLAKVEQSERQESNVWDEHVERYLAYLPPESHGSVWGVKRGPAAQVTEFFSSDIFLAVTGRDATKRDVHEMRAIAQSLKAKGWDQKPDKSRRWIHASTPLQAIIPALTLDQTRELIFG